MSLFRHLLFALALTPLLLAAQDEPPAPTPGFVPPAPPLLLAHWPFDLSREDSSPDVVGHLAALPVGDAHRTIGLAGGGLRLREDPVTVDLTPLATPPTSVVFGVWIGHQTQPSLPLLQFAGVTVNATYLTGPSARLQLTWRDRVGVPRSLWSSPGRQPPLDPRRWQLLALSVTPERLSLYVDGQLAAESTTGLPVEPATRLSIGPAPITIDELRCYSHPLTDGALASLAASLGQGLVAEWPLDGIRLSEARDAATGDWPITATGDFNSATDATRGEVVAVGEGALLSLPPELTGARLVDGLTLEVWAQSPDVPRDRLRHTLVDIPGGRRTHVRVDVVGGQVRFFQPGLPQATVLIAEQSLAGWRHLAVTLGDGSSKLYLDGRLVAEGPLPDSFFPLAAEPITLGPRFAGRLGPVALYSYPLTAEQLAQPAPSAPPPPPAAELPQ